MEKLRWEKSVHTNVSDVEYVEFKHFPKKIEQKSLECEMMVLQDEIKQDPLNSEKIKQLESIKNN